MKHTFHVNGDVKKQYCCFYVTEDPYALHQLPFNSPKFTFVLCRRSQLRHFLLKIEDTTCVTVTAGCYERKETRVFSTSKVVDTHVLNWKSGRYVCSQIEKLSIRVLFT